MTSVRLLSSRCTVRRLCNLAEPGATWHVAVTLTRQTPQTQCTPRFRVGGSAAKTALRAFRCNKNFPNRWSWSRDSGDSQWLHSFECLCGTWLAKGLLTLVALLGPGGVKSRARTTTRPPSRSKLESRWFRRPRRPPVARPMWPKCDPCCVDHPPAPRGLSR